MQTASVTTTVPAASPAELTMKRVKPSPPSSTERNTRC